MISDKLFFGCRVWIRFFWVPIPTYINWKKNPSRFRFPSHSNHPGLHGGRGADSSRRGFQQWRWCAADAVEAEWLGCPNSTDVFCGGNPLENPTAGTWTNHPNLKSNIIWTEPKPWLWVHFITLPPIVIQNHGWVEKWRDDCFQPIGSNGLVNLPTVHWSHKINSINVGKWYIPTSPMDPISGPFGPLPVTEAMGGRVDPLKVYPTGDSPQWILALVLGG